MDIRQRADDATDASAAAAALYVRLTSEIRARLLVGAYLARALRNVTHSLSGDWAPGLGY